MILKNPSHARRIAALTLWSARETLQEWHRRAPSKRRGVAGYHRAVAVLAQNIQDVMHSATRFAQTPESEARIQAELAALEWCRARFLARIEP